MKYESPKDLLTVDQSESPLEKDTGTEKDWYGVSLVEVCDRINVVAVEEHAEHVELLLFSFKGL